MAQRWPIRLAIESIYAPYPPLIHRLCRIECRLWRIKRSAMDERQGRADIAWSIPFFSMDVVSIFCFSLLCSNISKGFQSTRPLFQTSNSVVRLSPVRSSVSALETERQRAGPWKAQNSTKVASTQLRVKWTFPSNRMAFSKHLKKKPSIDFLKTPKTFIYAWLCCLYSTGSQVLYKGISLASRHNILAFF